MAKDKFNICLEGHDNSKQFDPFAWNSREGVNGKYISRYLDCPGERLLEKDHRRRFIVEAFLEPQLYVYESE